MATAPRKKTSTTKAGKSTTAKKTASSSSRKTGSAAKSPKRTAAKRKPAAAKPRTSASTARSADRADKSVEAFRDALERSVTLSRERIQEVVDDSVKRGRITRGDANEMISMLLARGRKQTEDLVAELERLLEGARGEVGGRAKAARDRAGKAAGRVAKSARVKADEPLAQADKLRRRAGVGSSFPILAYDDLSVAQVRSRLDDLGRPELRKVRTYESNNKARKGILDDIERRLG